MVRSRVMTTKTNIYIYIYIYIYIERERERESGLKLLIVEWSHQKEK